MEQENEFKDLTAALGALADRLIEPPEWLMGSVMETVSEKARRMAAARRIGKQVQSPRVLGGGALLFATVAGAYMLRGRRRRRRSGALRGLLAA